MRLFGILVLILGFASLLSPLASATVAATLVGIFLIIGGVVRLVGGIRSDAAGRIWAVILGVVMVVGGTGMFALPAIGVLSISLLLAIYFLADGIIEIFAAFRLKPARGWSALLFSGIVTLLLAWLIWSQWPLSGAVAVGVLVGVRLIFAGATMIMLGSALRRARNAKT